jgi:hypothetical protein
MKLMILVGAIVGFLIGMTFGWAQQSPWPSVLWRGAVAAYAAAVLMRWWGRVWVKSIQQVNEQRKALAARAAEAAEAAANSGTATTTVRP